MLRLHPALLTFAGLVESCNIIETGNTSYRFAQSKRRRKKWPFRKQSPQTDSLHEGGPTGGFAPQKVGQF